MKPIKFMAALTGVLAIFAAAFAVLAVCLPSAFLLLLLVLGNLQVRGHQEFAVNGVDQIAPARQMDEIFEDCKHHICYGAGNQPRWDAHAYFGDRYVLNMQVPVRIDSSESGEMIGEPEFLLLEVSKAGDHWASYGRNFRFNLNQWQQVYDAGGDFQVIGFEIDPTPAPGFEVYRASLPQ